MQENQLRLVREFAAEQRRATSAALIRGVREGMNPIATARDFRGSIGLTEYQTKIVANYRRSLETLSRDALERELRDRRFDRTVTNAIDGNIPLSQERIDMMVERYTEKWVKYRSEAIARTESLRAANAGSNELYRQAIDRGDLNQGDLIREWIPAKDDRVRDSHAEMAGQTRGVNEPFISGLGNELMYPGDPSSPAEDTIHCRCAVTTRFAPKARIGAGTVTVGVA
jgi:hypothetical protein